MTNSAQNPQSAANNATRTQDNDLAVYVAAHKPYEFAPDAAYRPIHVGRARSGKDLGFPGDDTGENISAKNQTYCELTATYWAAKNSDVDFVGLVHYRRYFAGSGWRGVATADELRRMLATADIVVPKRRIYGIETVRSHYARAHHESDFNAAREVLVDLSPQSVAAFDAVASARSLTLYNMFVMRRELLSTYTNWLFPILAELEQRIPIDTYGPQQARVIGYLSERLFNVWLLQHESTYRIHRAKVANLEGEPVVRKAINLFSRRFGKGRAV